MDSEQKMTSPRFLEKKYFKLFSTCLSFLLMSVLVTACARDKVLLQELDQHDLNEIVVLLSKNGIETKKEVVEKQQERTWTVRVGINDEQRARELLVDNRLPKKRELGLSGICKEAGLIPTPKTEKCRELLALKGEIINSLEEIPGVVNADVVLNIPDKEDFPDEKEPVHRPTASVVIEVGKMDFANDFVTESKIQQHVANAVTGMDLRDVAVIISYSGKAIVDSSVPDHQGESISENVPDKANGMVLGDDVVSIAGLKMDSRSAKKFKILAITLLVLFVLLSAGLILVLLQLAHVRQKQVVEQAGDQRALPQTIPPGNLVE